jgi:tetratricopeptide (TPR) repeat protein
MRYFKRALPFLLLMTAASTLSTVTGEARTSRAYSHPAQQSSQGRKEAAILVEEGASALGRNDLSSARKAFRRALAADPNNVAAHTYLGIIADRAGELAEAERHFAAALKADPKSPAALNNHGAILARMGRVEQAIRDFEASLRLNGAQPSALVNLAQLRFSSGTPEGLRAARELFRRARTIAPDAEVARALLVISLRLRDREAIIADYRDYRASLSGATAKVTAGTRAEIGAALLEAGFLNEAIEELSAAVEADPTKDETIILLARAHLARRDIPSAGRALESAVARGLETAPLFAALAEVYEQSGHIENAIPAMRLAIAHDPKNEFYRFRYGMLLTDTEAPEASIIRLQEALKEFPRSAKLWFALGVAYFTGNKLDEATKNLARAVELDPKFAPAIAYMGMTYDAQGQYQEAISHYERALSIDDRLAAAHYLAANALLKQASVDTTRVEKHLRRALELDASFAPSHLALGKVYLRTERLNEAVNEFERAVAADPNLAEGYYQLGRLYMRLKRTEEAQTALATFKRLSDVQQEKATSERKEITRRLANVRF